ALDLFKLYPNPTEGRVFVNLVLAETTDVQLSIMSITGQVLQSFEPQESLEQNYEIDMTDYPSGVYLARLVIDNKVITEKIIVE
uniref:T9SS type A sorting domain-containing protein n=1 Tax=Aureispira sp. CCB-QB1 TaxID=1313421 RepID=UPI00090796DF